MRRRLYLGIGRHARDDDAGPIRHDHELCPAWRVRLHEDPGDTRLESGLEYN
jgi:hypothetical protein